MQFSLILTTKKFIWLKDDSQNDTACRHKDKDGKRTIVASSRISRELVLSSDSCFQVRKQFLMFTASVTFGQKNI